jgi:DNA repair exonuclease SbcCD ATPase subunit
MEPGFQVVADGSTVFHGVAVGAVVLVVGFVALVVVGFVVLFRRRGDSRIQDSSPGGIATLSRQAGSLLVKLDDELRDAADELGYATAQFGADKAKPYADALTDAKMKVAEAFRLKQSLDDAYPDSDQQRREWTLQIIALCNQADTALSSQDRTFADLRSNEANAAGTLADLRSRIADLITRVDTAKSTIAALATTYRPTTVAQISKNPEEARKLLTDATTIANAAAPAISAQGVNDVSGTLQQAALSVQRADQLLDAVDATATNLKSATDALATLRVKSTADLVEAKVERDRAPDADTGKAIIDAIAGIQLMLSSRSRDPGDPVAALDLLGDAVSALDTALASARNQTERLEHARAAYAGTLVSVTSQITAAHNYITQHGGGVNARTRLAEAERQLTIAKAAVDPVEALDTVRRSVTLARDADALARYDTMGSRQMGSMAALQ